MDEYKLKEDSINYKKCEQIIEEQKDADVKLIYDEFDGTNCNMTLTLHDLSGSEFAFVCNKNVSRANETDDNP